MVELRLIPKEFNGTSILLKQYREPNLSIFTKIEKKPKLIQKVLTDEDKDFLLYLKYGIVTDTILPHLA